METAVQPTAAVRRRSVLAYVALFAVVVGIGVGIGVWYRKGLPHRLLKGVEARYGTAQGYRERASWTVSSSAGGASVHLTQTLVFRRPDRIRCEAEMDFGGRKTSLNMISDGTTLFLEDPEKRECLKMPAPPGLAQGAASPVGAEGPISAMALLSGTVWSAQMSNVKLLAGQIVAGHPTRGIQLSFSDGTQQTLWIGKRDHLIWKSETVRREQPGGPQIRLIKNLLEASLDKPPSDSEFAYIPAKGFRVVGRQASATYARRNTELVGKRLPEVSFPDFAGNQVSLASFRGRALLLTFWASW